MIFETESLKAITETTKVPVRPKKKRNVSYDELIHIHRNIEITEGYADFTKDKYPYGVVFYDFEVFMYDWLVVLIDPVNKLKTIICNNRAALKEYYETHKEMVWIGYNNKYYDVPILKGILLGYDPKEISDKLIIERKKAYEMTEYAFNKIQLYSYDVMVKKEPPESLKLLEGFMGDDIEETEVDFNLDRPLNNKEIHQTIKYCSHDVEETIEVFRYRVSDYDAQIALIEAFNLPFRNVSKTKGQITAIVTDCHKQEHNDEFEVTFVPNIQLNRYAYIMEWFKRILAKKSYYVPLENNPENAFILSKGKQIKKRQ